MKDLYKVNQLEIMLGCEIAQPEDKQYGAHITHWSGMANPINIDAGAIKLLIMYYKGEIQIA